MGTITISIDDSTEKSFRETVEVKKGRGKGILGSAVDEALKMWINGQKQEEIRKRQTELMKKGLYKLGKYKFNRNELYDR